MARPYQIILPLLSLFIVRVDVTDLFPLLLRVEVVQIIDADTVEVRKGARLFRVRLLKLDAPEKGQAFLDGTGDAGKVAKLCAERVIRKNRFYDLALVKQDIYGRYLGELGEVSLRLVEAGCSGIYPYTTFASKHEKFVFLRALKRARRNSIGLWKHGGFRQPMLWRKFSKRSARQRWHRSGRHRGTYPPGRRSGRTGG